MREILHQLTLALALPLAVATVWLVRGESGDAPRFESAVAHRVQLAPLPLPEKSQLRAPRTALDWRRAPAEAEMPLAPRRPALPQEPAPPLALAVNAEPASSPIEAAPLRAARVDAAPAVAARRAAPPTTLPLLATLPGLASPAAGPARVARTAAKADVASAAAKPALRAVASAAPAATAKPIASPRIAPALHHVGSPGAAPRERAGLAPLDDAWRERAKTSAPSPALAHGLREIDQALDLLPGHAKDTRSRFEQLVPTLPASAHPRELAASPAPPLAALPLPSAPAPDLGFAFPVLETLAAQLDDLADARDVFGFGSEPVYAPALRVTAIPEPGSAWLIGAGLAAVAAVRRRAARE
jgi:hypothetical protein